MDLTQIKNEISNYFNKTNSSKKVRSAEMICSYLQNFEDHDLGKWELKFKYGYVVTNNQMKKLYFKFGGQ